MIRVFVLFVVATCALATAAHAATYRWLDEHGATHYGEKPPPGVKAQELKIRIPPSPPAPAAAAAPDSKERESRGTRLQEQERDFQQRRIERLDKEREEEKRQARARAEAQRAKETCIAARNNLESLQKDRPVYSLDEKGGRQYIDDKTRATEIVRAKKEIKTYCKS